MSVLSSINIVFISVVLKGKASSSFSPKDQAEDDDEEKMLRISFFSL